jgi:hypothetical protein
VERNATNTIRVIIPLPAPLGARQGTSGAHQGALSCRPCASHRARSNTIEQHKAGEVLQQLPVDALGHRQAPRHDRLVTDFATNNLGLAA